MEKIKKFLWNIIVNGISASYLFNQDMRLIIYKIFRADIKGRISSGVYLGSKNIKIASNSFINKKCYFDERSYIEIEDGVFLGPEVMLCTSTHKISDSNMRAGALEEKPIIIKSGCWIGARATILPGVTIKEGCIVASGAVVINDCEMNGLYAGIPAKRVKELK